jgi:signal transduction histidine kinase/DNA-binding response OmpR family regulator/CHASE3 domain sensor protein
MMPRRVAAMEFGAAVVVLIAAGAVAYRGLREYSAQVALEEHTYQVLNNLSRFSTAIRTAESSARGYALSPDSTTSHSFWNALADTRDAFATLRALTADNVEQERRLDSLAPLVEQRLAASEALFRSPRLDSAGLAHVGVGRALMERIERGTARAFASEREILDERERAAQASGATAIGALLIGGTFAVLLVLLAARANYRELGDRMRAERALEREAQRQAVIIEVQQAVATTPIASDDLMHLIVDQVMHLFGADGAGIALRDGEDIVYRTLSGMLEPHAGLRVPVRGSLVGRVYQTAAAALVPDTESDTLIHLPRAREVGFRSALAIPLFQSGKVIGVLTAVARAPSRFGEDEMRGAQIMAGLLSAAFTNAAAAEANQVLLAELRRSRDEAEAATRAKSQFLATMSHELRTPLNSVIGFARLLQRNRAGNLGDQDLQFLDRIEQNGVHLLNLINDVLDLSKIEAGRVEVSLAPADIGALVRETVAQVGGTGRSAAVELRVEVPEITEPIQVDAARLKQVLINLVANALKFTEQGHVTVRVENEPGSDRPRLLEVEDTGIGIPADRQTAIFEAFQQADNTTERKYGGTGLGLTISRSLVEMMGATLTVRSEPEKGSTFTIAFGAKAAATAPVVVSPPDGTGPAILVIDDDPDARLLLQRYLEDAGYQVVAAGSGRDGVALARQFRPAIITLDLMMPEMSGWDVLRALKADPAVAEIPVVVVSVVAAEQEGRVLGVLDLIPKPVDRDRLVATVGRLLNRGGKSVLIVEGDPHQRRVLAHLMGREGYDVDTAADGLEGFQRLERRLPDLVLLDLAVPLLDGSTFLATLRNNPRHAHIPVVVVSGDLTADEMGRLRQQAAGVVRRGADLERGIAEVLEGLTPRGGPGRAT